MRLRQCCNALTLRWRGSTADRAALITPHPSTDCSLENFAARLEAMNAPKTMALAISGGRDSMALACLAADYAGRSGAQALALTVDHGLRPEAATEAAEVKIWCEALGLAHETLCWRGDKPSSGVQAAARAARYRLLIEEAQRHGCAALLTAHSLDDQAETFFMRLSRGAGARGLSCMREESCIAAGAGAPLRLLRPLLNISRQSITGYLHQRGQEFVDDPSNLDERYERVRVRALLAALAEQELLSADALAVSASKLAAADAAAQAQEDSLFDSLGGCFHSWGGVSLDRWAGAPGSAGLARRLVHAVSGGEFAPDADAAAAAMAQASRRAAATLGGALIKKANGRLWVLREPAALLGRAGVEPMARQKLTQPVLWDRRFILTPEGGGPFDIAPLGAAAEAFLGPRASLFGGPPEALYGLPGLYQEGVLIGAPALPFMGVTKAMSRSLTRERFDGGIVRYP